MIYIKSTIDFVESGYYSITNMPVLIIRGTMPFVVKLGYNDNGSIIEFFTGSYTFIADEKIELDFKDVLLTLFDNKDPQLNLDFFTQPNFIKTIRIEVSDTETTEYINFNVLNINAHSTSNIVEVLKKRFLTQQPSVKVTTVAAPEFLTYFYTDTNFKLVVKIYYLNNVYDIKTLYQWDGQSHVVTHNVSPSKVLGLSLYRRKPFYDIYVVDGNDQRISSIQRYVVKEPTERENYYLFYNSFGGLDTLITIGSNIEIPKVKYELAQTSLGLLLLDNNKDYIEYEQNSGFFSKEYISLIEDFLFSKKKKYIFTQNICNDIIVTENELQFDNKDVIVSFSFHYRKLNDITQITNIDIDSDLIVEYPIDNEGAYNEDGHDEDVYLKKDLLIWKDDDMYINEEMWY